MLSAGEITFLRHRSGWGVESISNQSTGFCPEPESWEAVTAALDGTGLESPKGWSNEILFRRCPRCGERNIVKDSWFLCDMCDAELPKTWNFTTEEQ